MKFYGCYGVPTEIGFSITDWNLLEEDWMIMYPLVRGGGDFGSTWHKEAILEKKYKTVDDLEDAAKFIIASGISHTSLLCAKSNSAGAGMLASLLNRNTDLFKAVILDAPFLDIFTMLSNHEEALT